MATEKTAPIQNDYIRLAGVTRDRPTGIPRLYLGPNHLLLLNRKSTREVARRFYYEDITALRCHPTRWGYYIDGTFVAVAALLWLNYLISPSAGIGSAFAAVTATVIAGIALLTNWLRGPTCETWLHTANHTERLSSLGRYNTALRALGKLHDRIVAAQEARFGEHIDVARSFEPYAPPAAAQVELPVRRHDPRVMKGAFFVALFSALLGCLDFFYGNDGTIALGFWTEVVSAALCAAAIVQSYGTDCPHIARRMCAYILTLTTLTIPITLAAMAFLVLNGVDPGSAESVRDVHPSDGLLFFVRVGLDVGKILFDGTCAVTGLVVLSRKPTP